VVTYGYRDVIAGGDGDVDTWAGALADADVAVCTVHPPRDGFHCSVFGARVIRERGLDTTLIPKTGTIVPEYKREFYLPDETINHAVIAITGFTRDYLVNTYRIPADRVALIYQGTEVELFTPDPARLPETKSRYPLPGNAGPVLGCIGSFEERKGQVKLLEALLAVRDRHPNVHLMLVGDGPDETMLREQVRQLGLSDNVSFFPFTDEPVYAFERLDILVLPSLYKEGLPNVILEAMSMHLPVVASRMAGIPEVVKNGETGCLVEPGDAAGLAAAVDELWRDRKVYQELSANARKLMAAGFDKRNQFKAFLDHFETLTATG
jgi:glycosyltransferase involved in cell wall biosynthesis